MFTLSIRSPNHRMTGIAMLLPIALYRAVSEAPGMSVHPSGKPWSLSYSTGVSLRITLGLVKSIWSFPVANVRLFPGDNKGPFPPPGFPCRIRRRVGKTTKSSVSKSKRCPCAFRLFAIPLPLARMLPSKRASLSHDFLLFSKSLRKPSRSKSTAAG